MIGPLAQQFAQVRGGILPPHTASNRHEHRKALVALSSIERHVQDMEKALDARWRELLDHADESDGTGEHVGFARHYRAKAEGVAEALEIVRAALPAREKGTE